MATPTQMAENSFRHARIKIESMVGQAYGEGRTPSEMKEALSAMCDGLSQLSVGVRATYALVSEVKTLLAQSQAPKLPLQAYQQRPVVRDHRT